MAAAAAAPISTGTSTWLLFSSDGFFMSLLAYLLRLFTNCLQKIRDMLVRSSQPFQVSAQQTHYHLVLPDQFLVLQGLTVSFFSHGLAILTIGQHRFDILPRNFCLDVQPGSVKL